MNPRTLLRSACVGVALAGLAVTLAGQALSPEETARRYYDSGLKYLREGNYPQALKDFQTIVDSFQASSVVGDARVQIATYHLEIEHDLAKAQVVTDVIKKSPKPDLAAMGHVLSGRIAMAQEPADLKEAVASFERVPLVFPRSDIVPIAMYYAGEALRAGRQYDQALDRFREVTDKYPTSEWSAKALLRSALCLLRNPRPGAGAIPATLALQRVRNQFPGSPEAATALKWNTILYRLYIRPPAGQPPYAFSGRYVGSAAKFKDVVSVALDRNDNLFLGYKTGVTVFDSKGEQVRSLLANDPSALALDVHGVPVLFRQNTLLAEGASRPISLSITQPDGKIRTIDDIPAAAMVSRGDWLIADAKANAVQLFSAAGNYRHQFAAFAADRLSLDESDTVLALNRNEKSLVVVDRENKQIARVSARGQGYQLEEPVDAALDALGHLYVLDRSLAEVFVFTPEGRFATSFTIPEKNPGAFRKASAFGLDSAGRLYIFDERVQRVQVYQ
jgi:TolA-binding protein